MDILLLLLAFFGIFWLGVGFHIAFVWFVKREALSQMNRVKNSQMHEKRITATNDTAVLLAEIKEVFSEEGEFKEKLPKIINALSGHPEASEFLFNKLKRFI